MRLLPTDIDIAKLYCFIDPETRFLLAELEHNSNNGYLNFKGQNFEYASRKTEFPNGPGVVHASSWDEI